MTITTWNCHNGECRNRASLLASFQADITILQECTEPTSDSECVWFPNPDEKGVGVVAHQPWRAEKMRMSPTAPGSVFPVIISGPSSLHVLAVWAKDKGRGNWTRDYTEAIWSGLDHYREFLKSGPAVVAGDFNSHPRWDECCKPTHSEIVRHLENEFGLISAFHIWAERQNVVEKPTYYRYRKHAKPYHIDYCFVPREWSDRISSVQIGSYAEWITKSDHMPVTVEVDDSAFLPNGL